MVSEVGCSNNDAARAVALTSIITLGILAVNTAVVLIHTEALKLVFNSM